jgi:hypothetical protein
MNVGIVGSRHHPEWERAVREYVRQLPRGVTIVSGACPNSPDAWAESEARVLGVPTLIFPPKPALAGRVAYAQACEERNWEIAEHADRLVAFWDGRSPGTAQTMRFATELGKPVERVKDLPGVAWP